MATRILVAVVCAPVFFVVLFFAPPVGTALMFAAISALAAYELLRAANVCGEDRALRAQFGGSAAVSAVLICIHWLTGLGEIMTRAMVVALLCVLFFYAIRRYGTAGAVRFEDILITLFAGLVIPSCLACLVRLRMMDNGRYLVLLPVICAFLTDAGAYFAGVFLGKHRGITQVSPNKSLEGYIGGILSGAVFLLLYGLILERFAGLAVSYPLLAVYGLTGSAVTELGDLSFSLIKRQYGVKDYGHLLPGHGGMLDRFDSMIFAAPTLLLLVECLPAF